MPGTQELNYGDRLTGPADAGLPVIEGRKLAERRWEVLVPHALASAREQGYLCLDLSPVHEAVIQNTLDRAKEFFAWPDDRKAAVRDKGSESGWTPSYEEPAYQPGTISNVESFDIERPLIEGPDDPHWPGVPNFRPAVIDCWRELAGLADSVLELLARAAGLNPRFLADSCKAGTLNTMRLLHYPGSAPPSDPGEVGIAAHTDFECITLIYQTAPGLELRNVQGEWRDAPAGHGQLIVLLDDMLERWTNGYFEATGHRVRRTPGRRYSLVMFIAVNEGIEVAPLPEFVSAHNPARYAPVQQGAHIEGEMARSRAQMQGRSG
jgi:isopenicillin N synthase-like dioxygenase